MPYDTQIKGAAGPSPQTYLVPNSTEIVPRVITATFDGTAASGDFRPTVEIVSDGGVVVARVPCQTTVSAGGTAEVSFFPWGRVVQQTSSITYAERITLLKAKYTCVAEWQLDNGSSPYADTSGFAPADPATLTRQVRVTPMTQANASGPLATAPAGPSVAFNFDGAAGTGSGDFLLAGDTTPARYQFPGNDPFTVVGWLLPGLSVNVHDGPVISVMHVTGFGTPAAVDNGWRLNVSEPSRVPQFQRAANVDSTGSYDTAAGSALSTSGWSMVVGTYDGATLRLYVNGSLVSTAASAGGIVGSASNATVGEGAHKLGDFGTWYFGAAAQISVWAATFTQQDITDLFTSASGT